MPRAAQAPISPLKLPRGVRHLLVYGGSFDPPHFYHILAPLTIATRMYEKDAWVLYVPAARNPLKQGGPYASDEHRLAMLRLALDVPGPRSIWTDEIDRAAWGRAHGVDPASYTVDTLRRLRKVVPKTVELRLLIGSDQAWTFHRWKEPREVIRLAEPLVLAREPTTTACDLVSALSNEGDWSRTELRQWCTRLAPNFPLEKSSTETRDAIPGAPSRPGQWQRREGLKGITTPVVVYIMRHNLYGFRDGAPKPADARPALLKGVLALDRAGREVVGSMLINAGKTLMKPTLAKKNARTPVKRKTRPRGRV